MGRRLVAQHREFSAHLQNGSSYEDIGQSYIEEQIRLYLVYTTDRPMWQQLVSRCEQHALQDRNVMSPMYSPWGYLHSDLVEKGPLQVIPASGSPQFRTGANRGKQRGFVAPPARTRSRLESSGNS